MHNLLRVAVLLLLLTSCEFRNIEINGEAPGWDNATVATVSIKDGEKTIYAENIKDGKFSIPQQPLEQIGYYTLSITTSGKNRQPPQHHEIYLEPGKYYITLNPDKRGGYPLITSSSPIQNDLTTYHRFTDSVMSAVRSETDKWFAKFNDPKAALLPDKEYQDILANVKLWQDNQLNAEVTTMAAFVTKYPHNKAVVRVLNNMTIDRNQVQFYNIYQHLADDVKNSVEGKEVGDKLKSIVNLLPGSVAPQLDGLTPDGKKIKVTDMGTRLVVVEFWRPGYYSISRGDHTAINKLLPSLDPKKVKIISVSINNDKDVWLDLIKRDKLSWLQVSDLKGDDSPNVKNWNLSQLPIYYILDGNTGKVIYPDLSSYQAMTTSIEEYFRAHP